MLSGPEGKTEMCCFFCKNLTYFGALYLKCMRYKTTKSWRHQQYLPHVLHLLCSHCVVLDCGAAGETSSDSVPRLCRPAVSPHACSKEPPIEGEITFLS